MNNLTELQSCYDRQLANVCGVVEISVGIERWVMQLFTKLMQKFENNVNTTYGISEEKYCGRYDPMGGLSQGLMLVGTNNRVKSCFIFKKLELGIWMQ